MIPRVDGLNFWIQGVGAYPVSQTNYILGETRWTVEIKGPFPGAKSTQCFVLNGKRILSVSAYYDIPALTYSLDSLIITLTKRL